MYGASHDSQRNPLRVGSIKGNIGHSELAAGLMSLIKAVEMIRARTFFPTGGCDIVPRSDFDWLSNNIRLCRENEPFPSDDRCYVGVNSFGVGGSYAMTIIAEYDGVEDDVELPESSMSPLLLTLNAVSGRHLALYEERIFEYLQANHGEVSLLSLCGLFAVNRPTRLGCSRSYVVHSINELMVELRSDSKGSVSDSAASNLTLALVFTGQGSQWVGMGMGLMAFRAYREVTTRFDALYKRLAGWSPLEKLESLSGEQLDQTMYAQPLTFMVQVGLVELLGAIGVRADVVVGHSAGELAALYCSGMLSLPDAAAVVWHRSRCQQAVSGNGRMLAVQLDLNNTKEILRDASLGVSSCEVACINSPTSVVLGGPEAELDRVRRYLSTKEVKSTFLRGTTAFHCSLMDPILPEVDAKLKFLNSRGASAMTPFLSTVTGRLHSTLTSSYVVHNIRQPVRFHETIDLLLRSHEPDVILELGPHPTLAPLLVECVQSANRQASVLSSLSKGANDVACFWKIIKGLTEVGVYADLTPVYYDLGYRFSRVADSRIPKHPIISRQVESWIVDGSARLRKREVGPAAGAWVSRDDKLVSVIEVSQATSSPMEEHIMGGIAILPGMYYVEAAIEACGQGHVSDDAQVGISMTDVTFHAMCPIPDRTKTQPRKLFVRQSGGKSSEVKSFTVESRPIHSSEFTVHCTGELVLFARPGDVLDGSHYLPGVKGSRMKSSTTRDIGHDGIRKLLESHYPLSSSSQFYGQVCEKDTAYYGPSFQVIDEVRTSADRSSIVATLNFDHGKWSAKGGLYGVQLLDGMLQLCFLNPFVPSGNVSYAGGFDWGLFVRAPVENPCIVHFQFAHDESFGDSIVHGDALMYDANGRLLCHLMGIKSIIGKQMMKLSDSVPVWQPMSLAARAPPSQLDAARADHRLSGCPSSAVARVICDVLRKKHAIVQGACHLRVLEVWEDPLSVPSVFAALASVKEGVLPSDFDFLVEVFVATHQDSVIKRGYHIPKKRKGWLKLRLVSLPSGSVLDNFSFDVMVRIMGADHQDNWTDPADFLRFASRFGYYGSIILHDFDACQVSKSWVREEFVGACMEHADGVFSSCSLLEGAILGARGGDPSDLEIFVVCRDSDLARRVNAAFEQVALRANCTARVRVSLRSIHHADMDAIRQLAGDVSCSRCDERHVIVLDGALDESAYAQDTFVLAARAAEELGSIATGSVSFLWLITSNAFVPPINVHRASIHPLITAMINYYPDLRPKYVDLPSTSLGTSTRSLESLAALILTRPGPHKYMIDVEGVVHQRLFLPRELACAPRKVSVAADDPSIFFKLDLVKTKRSTGERPYEFFAYEVKPPKTGEVLVDVQYASLNFRDVMLTLNALPRSSMAGSFFGYDLGMEAAGTVVEVGPGVHHVVPGDHVMVSAKGSIASKVIASAGNISRLGSSIQMKDAACLSSVYTTAYHSLIDLCRLRKGDRVLIHAAAGGVGHAAISICRYLDAEVFCTVSRAKREYCIKNLGVPEQNVFNSRDVGWFDDLMRATDDEGVDIVINSLAGEHQLRGIQSLRPGGRFCEIGKIDIYNNEKLLMFAFRKNIRFFAIDMDRMTLEDPAALRSISEKVAEGLVAGHFQPLPYTIFSMDNIHDAVELMKSGKHVGKVLLSNRAEDGGGGHGKSGPLTIQSNAIVRCGGDKYHLVLGGAGGIGSKLIRWLHSKGARKFLVTVRRNPSRVTKVFEDLIAAGAIFEVVEADLSNPEGYEIIEKTVFGSVVDGQVESCVHAVGFWEPFYFSDIQEEPLKLQADVKVQAALFLDSLSRKLGSVARFILIGSNSDEQTASLLVSYGASNAMLAALGRMRLSEGLPATLLSLPTIIDVGVVAVDEQALASQRKLGYPMINSASAIMTIDSMIAEDTHELVQAVYVGPQRSGDLWSFAPWTGVADPVLLFENATNSRIDNALETYDAVLERVQWLFVDSMGVGEDDVTASTSLTSLGIDSLGIVDIGQQLKDQFGYTMDRTAFSMTVADLAKDVHQSLKDMGTTGSELAEVQLQQAGEDIVHNDIDRSDDNVLGVTGSQRRTKSLIRSHNRVANPVGFVLICSGVVPVVSSFANWKLRDIQVLHVDLPGAEWLESESLSSTANSIATELYAGYLKDGLKEGVTPKCVLFGYSYGALMALEICRELLEVYSFRPTALVPCCQAAPQSFDTTGIPGAVVSLLPNAVQKHLVEKVLGREYRLDESGESADGLANRIPSSAVIIQALKLRRKHAVRVARDLKRRRREGRKFIGDVPVHHVFASHDRLGNGNGNLRGPPSKLRNAWAELTGGTFRQTQLYGTHSCLVDLTYGPAARDCVLDILEGLMF